MRTESLTQLIYKINPSQKKIILIAILVIFTLFGFWILIYSPTKNAVKQLKADLSSVERQIHEVEAITDKTKSFEEGIKALDEIAQELDSKLPSKENETLRILSDFARKLNLEIVSIRPEPRTTYLDANNQKIEIEGKACQKVFVSLELRCSYKEIVEYLETIKGSSLLLVNIERLRIDRGNSGPSKLNIKLDLNLFLLS